MTLVVNQRLTLYLNGSTKWTLMQEPKSSLILSVGIDVEIVILFFTFFVVVQFISVCSMKCRSAIGVVQFSCDVRQQSIVFLQWVTDVNQQLIVSVVEWLTDVKQQSIVCLSRVAANQDIVATWFG